MSIPVVAGHTYIYVKNLTDKPLRVGLYDVPAGEGVSIGSLSVSVSDGWGLYYNLEAHRENRDDHFPIFGQKPSRSIKRSLISSTKSSTNI